MPRAVVLGLGSNVGSREALLRAAADLLDASPQLGRVARSRVVRTHAVGPPQADYLNAAVLAYTDLAPVALLALARETERTLARERRERWGPRTIDVDVLWIAGEHATLPSIVVPHPALDARAFALGPMLELVPDARDAATGEPYAARYARLAAAFLDAPRALGAAFAPTARDAAGFHVAALDRADLLAAAAEALMDDGCDATRVVPRDVLEVRVAAPSDAWSDAARLTAWLAEVARCVRARRFAVRRAVVFGDDAHGVRGALLGEPLARARDAALRTVARVTVEASAAHVAFDP